MTAASDDPELISLLLEQADRLLRGEVTREILARADAGEFPQALWDACEAAGLPLALVPEAGGGVGLSIAQGLRLVRQLGYHAAPLPLPETMLARMLWHEAGGADVDGILTLAPAAEPLALTTAGGAPVLSGNVQRVPWGGSAAHVLVPVRDAQGDEHLLLAANAQ
ncbi:MAG: acyl-CoA dehydrogenase family protein, partial [Burkholderiales bacterium]|nr:acyl-CoA dehydrogenase family protein [Burkholderiales bacterium]